MDNCKFHVESPVTFTGDFCLWGWGGQRAVVNGSLTCTAQNAVRCKCRVADERMETDVSALWSMHCEGKGHSQLWIWGEISGL